MIHMWCLRDMLTYIYLKKQPSWYIYFNKSTNIFSKSLGNINKFNIPINGSFIGFKQSMHKVLRVHGLRSMLVSWCKNYVYLEMMCVHKQRWLTSNDFRVWNPIPLPLSSWISSLRIHLYYIYSFIVTLSSKYEINMHPQSKIIDYDFMC